ncbi:site-2 protease family protein [Candidatus Saccharibacteria bacterium]|nr:site-2 protease family protein [Candidatus Saccharibacteria bacterium]
MDIFVGVIVGLLVLMLLVTAHEFGHFIAARRNGVNVLEFGICFPPRLAAWVRDPKTKKWHRLPKSEWKKPQKGLIFSLNLLPVGGFCQMDGESASDTRDHTFGKASFWKKTKILFAGVAMNWLASILILTILAWTGMPTFIENQFTIEPDTRRDNEPVMIESVLDDSPAAKAELKSGDKILKIGETTIITPTDVNTFNQAHAGEEVTYTIDRNGEKLDIKVALNSSENTPLLGVSMSAKQSLSYSSWSAPLVGVGLTVQLTGETFKGVGQLIGNLFSGVFSQFSFNDADREAGRAALSDASDQVSGPVGIIGQIFPTFTSAGATNVAFLAALISISLACMNVIPIPALDGGRWLLIAIFKLRKKELTKETEEKIVARAFLFLLILFVLITVLDIKRFF